MTCIVGYARGGYVTIGGDSAASNLSIITESGRPKVFRKGPLIFGYSGSFRVGQVVEHLAQVPPHPPEATDIEYMVGGIIEHIRYCLKSCGVVDINNAVEMSKGTMLIGYNGTLYEMDSDFQIRPQQMTAIGSGFLPALGVMHYLEGAEEEHPPVWMLQKALETAEKVTPFVRGPFEFVTLEPDSGRAPPPPKHRKQWREYIPGLQRSQG